MNLKGKKKQEPAQMHKYQVQFAWLCMMNFLLSACASMDSPRAKREFSCVALNNEVVFSTLTANTRNQEIQLAEQYLEERNFDVKCQNCRTSFVY